MEGIISLVDPFSVHCVITEGGRVSLAHLMEFSHFIDLYVLEESIWFNEIDMRHVFNSFVSDKNGPLLYLSENNLSDYVFRIAVHTLNIYDYSPKERQFSVKSYDYWLKSSTRKEKITNYDDLNSDRDYGSRANLLIASREMEEDLINLLEELGKTQFCLLPSTRTLIPFLESYHQFETPAQKLYKNVALKHKQLVNSILELQRPRTVYLPPLLTILLSRCENRQEIPKRLAELRFDYTNFRNKVKRWQNEMSQSKTIKDQIKLRDELDSSYSSISERFEEKRRGFYKNISGAFLDAFEDGDLKHIITKPAVALVKEGLNFLPDFIRSRRFTGMIDLLDQSLNVNNYSSLLSRIFGKDLDISQYEITNARKYQKVIESRYSIQSVLST